jgi:sec-independent protein translocase protein TatA
MGGASIWHWIVVGLIVVLLFGRGKISEMMGDVAKGIKAFKKGMSEDEAAPATGTTTTTVTSSEPVKSIDHQPGTPSGATTTEHKVG